MKYLLAIIITMLFIDNSFSQWTKIESIPEQEIVAIANMNDTLYVASGTNLIYKSVNFGLSWNELSITNQSVSIYTLKIIDNKIFIGTVNNGIFISEDFGSSWTNYNNSMPAVSGFVKFNNYIYSSTVGNGVYRYDTSNNIWIQYNNQLPSNIAYNVETIASTSNNLIIGAGANGVFYQYNFISNQWDYYYYYSTILPGLLIQRIINQSDTLYAINGNRIIRSNDGGTNWSDDKIGSRNGIDRNMFVGSNYLYSITNLITGGTWIQKRNKSAAIGTNWNTDEELLPIGYSYDIFEFKNKLFIAKEDGLYVKDLVLNVDNPNNIINQLKIFPNPSKEGKVNINSPFIINKIYLHNSLGQLIYKSEPQSDNFNLEDIFIETGVYLIIVYFNNNLFLTKKLMIE